MHPIEQLRYVARATGADASLLVQEAASALGVFRDDRPALVTAARRLLTRQPAVGPLWWMCSRMSMSHDIWEEGRLIVDELRSDRTGRELAHHLPDGATIVISGWPDIIVDALPRRGDLQVLVVDVDGQGSSVVRRLERADVIAEELDASHLGGALIDADVALVEAAACGPAAVLTDVGSLPLVATARAVGTPTWLVVGVGRRLPEPYWQEVAERTADRDLPPWISPYDVISLGLVDRVLTDAGLCPPKGLGPSDLVVAPELLRELG